MSCAASSPRSSVLSSERPARPSSLSAPAWFPRKAAALPITNIPSKRPSQRISEAEHSCPNGQGCSAFASHAYDSTHHIPRDGSGPPKDSTRGFLARRPGRASGLSLPVRSRGHGHHGLRLFLRLLLAHSGRTVPLQGFLLHQTFPAPFLARLLDEAHARRHRSARRQGRLPLLHAGGLLVRGGLPFEDLQF